ncbi:MAG: acyltransferase family protein [Lachnospiraceae bacterium]|nr:acyltransferase family protein [Lachnospiraceae bacterium]
MNILVFLIYPALLACLFIGTKFAGKQTYHENPLGNAQTKAVCALLSVCIILHHLSQKAAAQLAAKDPGRLALEPFRNIGYLFVAYFFFCSGFGLYKSFSSKPDYLKGFLPRHLMPLILTFLITDCLFQYARISRKAVAFPANTYSWFVFVLMLFYIVFYLCCRFLGKHALTGIIICSLLFCILCRCTYTQSYWYNSISAFPLGVFFAKQEASLLVKMRKKYPVNLVLCFLLTIALIFLADSEMRIYHFFGGSISFDLACDIRTLLQLLAALVFPVLISMLSLKLQIHNKVLSFLGSMTLETYLVHVFFVEIFCKRFIGSYNPFFYIKNPVLYLLAVIILTMPVAFLIKKLREKLAPVILKDDDAAWAAKILKSAALIICAVVLLAVAYFSITSHMTTSKLKASMEAYKNEYETFVDVDGKQISAYVTGEGEHTFLLLGDSTDPAASMLLRPFAEHLSKYGKVIVPDAFGSGYSDSTNQPRTSENLAYEMHAVADALNDGKPVILFSCVTSGIYATTYLNTYPDDVEGLIGYDMITSAISKSYYDEPTLTDEQIYYAAKCSLERGRLFSQLLKATGFIRMELVTYNEAFTKDVMKDHIDKIDEMFIAKYTNPESVQTQAHMITDARHLSDFTLPTDLPVLMMSTNGANYDPTRRQIKMLQKLVTNEERHTTKLITGYSLSIYYQPRPILEPVSQFMKTQYH